MPAMPMFGFDNDVLLPQLMNAGRDLIYWQSGHPGQFPIGRIPDAGERHKDFLLPQAEAALDVEIGT